MSTELVAGVVRIYGLEQLFVGTPASSVTHDHHNRSGHQGRIETRVELSGQLWRHELLEVYNLNKTWEGMIDNMHFEFYLREVSEIRDEWGEVGAMTGNMSIVFWARRVPPKMHPVLLHRRRKISNQEE